VGAQLSDLGGRTPICSDCGISLCWDISEEEFQEDLDFWLAWKCRDCNPDYRGSLKRYQEAKHGRSEV